MTGPERQALEARWLDLTRRRLPDRAAETGWPLRLDHCFQRVLLDHACGGRWYDHIVGRPAYAHAPDAVLTRAIATGEALLTGKADLAALNARSLAWRGKLRTPPDRRSAGSGSRGAANGHAPPPPPPRARR